RIELRAAEKLFHLRPFVGIEASGVGNAYLLAGLSGDIFLGRRFVLTPNAAFGYFRDVDELDLGYALQFRTGFELAYRFNDRSRLGLTFHHISNADLGDRNPGTEVAMVQYSLPFQKLLP
ncbi:MAG: acyloxyacyl hydrolase, partial [Pseudomonadota bacterium]